MENEHLPPTKCWQMATAIHFMAVEYMHVCFSQVKLHHYPRVCGSEVLCLLSRSGWARFLRPVGADHRVTDREQHTDDPLSTSSRTVQPLSPEADPFVQGETLGDGSKGRRNDLEWRSRELAKQEVGFLKQKHGGLWRTYSPSRTRFPNSSCGGHVSDELRATVSSPGKVFPQADWILHQFIWSYCQE